MVYCIHCGFTFSMQIRASAFRMFKIGLILFAKIVAQILHMARNKTIGTKIPMSLISLFLYIYIGANTLFPIIVYLFVILLNSMCTMSIHIMHIYTFPTVSYQYRHLFHFMRFYCSFDFNFSYMLREVGMVMFAVDRQCCSFEVLLFLLSPCICYYYYYLVH